MLTQTEIDYDTHWQLKLADQLKRGRLEDIRIEQRQGLHHVLACYRGSEGQEVCTSHAYFSKRPQAEQALRRIRRLATLN